jgi:twinkle protein
MNLEKYRVKDDDRGKKNAYIFKANDVYDTMLNGLKNGKIKGTTTYNTQIDQCWTWKQQEANIWTGYANEGKSLWLKQLCLIKALKENKKFIFCSPEDFPPDEFYDDFIHTLTGVTTDKFYTERVVSEELYEKAYNMIKDLFIFLYIEPPHNTIRSVLEEFRRICKSEKDIFGCVIDPLLKFARPKEMADSRDDIYASYIGSICVDFARQTNTSFHLVMHQVTPILEKDTRKYPEPSMYRVKGGGSYADGFDNVLAVWRPNYASDKLDSEVQFSSQKIKKQKLVGIPQRLQMRFDRKSNRYKTFDTNQDIFDFNSIFYSENNRRLTPLSQIISQENFLS